MFRSVKLLKDHRQRDYRARMMYVWNVENMEEHAKATWTSSIGGLSISSSNNERECQPLPTVSVRQGEQP